MFFIILLLTLFSTSNIHAQGMNVTGLEKTWDLSKTEINRNYYQRVFKNLNRDNVEGIRLPIDLNYFLNQANNQEKRKFKKLIKNIVSYQKQNTPLVLAYFNHNLTHENYKAEANLIAKNWIILLQILEKEQALSKNLFLEIANEPTIYPHQWRESAKIIIEQIRSCYPNLHLIVGSSNYNSIYELSRLEPLPYENIIYTFHFYEPFIFTHQGTEWTGPQNSTTGIPFPFPDSTKRNMPDLAPQAKGTPGEINYRDYQHTGTLEAINHKISSVANWRDTYGVETWCTEYGVTQNADSESRRKYLQKVSKTLKAYNIPGFIWEYEGNFGVYK
ncbi:Cellulase (glycosyl hydrolase family 5) [Salegentibacter salarius]|nr:Cellulase (glycosyl hydrolase family 5) [Salegentibacter salarius]